jgi:hypothetical protein
MALDQRDFAAREGETPAMLCMPPEALHVNVSFGPYDTLYLLGGFIREKKGTGHASRHSIRYPW